MRLSTSVCGCIASMFVGRVRQCFSAVWADGFSPVSSSFPGDVRGIGAAACIFPSCDSNWIRPVAAGRCGPSQREGRGHVDWDALRVRGASPARGPVLQSVLGQREGQRGELGRVFCDVISWCRPCTRNPTSSQFTPRLDGTPVLCSSSQSRCHMRNASRLG